MVRLFPPPASMPGGHENSWCSATTSDEFGPPFGDAACATEPHRGALALLALAWKRATSEMPEMALRRTTAARSHGPG